MSEVRVKLAGHVSERLFRRFADRVAALSRRAIVERGGGSIPNPKRAPSTGHQLRAKKNSGGSVGEGRDGR
jgi:hypothetical protein